MKKKSLSRWIAVLVCLSMCLFSLSACGKKESQGTAGKDSGTKQEQKEEQSSLGQTEGDQTEENETDKENQNQTDSEAAGGEQPGGMQEAEGGQLPISEEKTELSFWLPYDNLMAEDPNTLPSVQKMEELTNVHIRYITVGMNEQQEKYGLMLASGEIPDIVKEGSSMYSGGSQKAVEDGIFLDLTDYIERLMPNYMGFVKADETMWRDVRTDDGRFVTIYEIDGDETGPAYEPTFMGLLIRGDWLEELKLPVPETLEDWHKVLTAFKEEKGAEAPLMIGTKGTIPIGYFASAFGVLPGFYRDGSVVKYGPAEEGYREYLKLFHQWYEEGLIDYNFISNNADYTAPAEYMATGRAGAGCSTYVFSANEYYRTFGYSQDEKINLVGTPFPVQNQGDEQISAYPNKRVLGSIYSISATCKNPELALKWLDYQYSYDAMLLNNFGIEGESYTIDENGKPQLTEQIQQNPDGLGMMDALKQYVIGYSNGWYNWKRYDSLYDPSVKLCQEVWDQASLEHVLPSAATMTAEESNEFYTLYTSVQTMVEEMTVKYITGAESLEDYDGFVEKLHQYGVDRCLEIRQNAYDRYLAR